MLKNQPYDLCVVGSGVAGALVAAQAAQHGERVAIIEAGRQFERSTRLDQLRSYQILGTRLWPWENGSRDTFQDSSTSDLGYAYKLNRSRVKAVGGSTLHWGGMVNRFWESDFRTASSWGLGVDWPIRYADLEPYYCLAEQELGVSGIPNRADPPRSQPYPMEGFPPRYGESAWMSVADKLNIELDHASHARNSRSYRGRPACSAFAVCTVCPIGARYSADFHVQEALDTGRVTLLTETVARRVEVNAAGDVQAIHATTLSGDELELKADHYVIAAHAVESARLLLLSNVGNHSDQVGRNLMEHWYAGAGGTVESPVFPGRIGFATMECSHWYEGPDRRDRGAIKLGFVDNFDPLGDSLSDGLFATDLANYDCEQFGHWVGVIAEIEHLPNPDSRVSLAEDEWDAFGDPVPHVHFALSATDRRTHELAHEYIATLLQARGCKNIEPMANFVRAHHHMGTCRMSSDPNDGVVDANCRVHGTSNLYLAGASVFPTGAGRQPTLTIAALALRLADHLRTED